MAIDYIPHKDTADLVSLKNRRLWPCNIPISHWQLRHFISSPEPNHIYYASGKEVFCLNTSTKQHRLLTTLQFDARCTASGYGWVCVGGEKEGHYFAAIKLDGWDSREVDAALPLDAWRGARRAPSIRVARVGEQIINSISIHRITDEEAHLDDIVAVLTNNDRTVRVFSLPQNTEADTIELPHPVNHATISPDGKTMCVVGDEAMVFFYTRVVKKSPPQIPKPHNRLTSKDLEWDAIDHRQLYVSSPQSLRGYFTTAWSPDGALVAVGSEDGYITVFDASKIGNPDCEPSDLIYSIVPSSRPGFVERHPGAVRAMMFSPAPWDLLVWAEDQGRVCVSDLRSGLRSKQVLVLDPKDEAVERIEDSEFVREGTRTPEWVDGSRSERPSDSRVQQLIQEQATRRRRLGLLRRDDPSDHDARRWETQRLMARLRTAYTDDPQGLSAREQLLLDTLRESRQRQEARHADGLSTVEYASPESIAQYGRNYPTRARLWQGGETPELVPSPSRTLPLSGVEAAVAAAAEAVATFQERSSTFERWDSHGEEVIVFDPPAARTTRDPREMGEENARGTNFLPTPPGSQPADTPQELYYDREEQEDLADVAERYHEAGGDSADGEDDNDDDDIWRHIDDESSRGPLFEHASRATPATRLPTTAHEFQEHAAMRAEAAREGRVIRQRDLIRERERLRNARLREGAAAAAVVTNYNELAANMPTLSRTRALDLDNQGYEALLRRRGPAYYSGAPGPNGSRDGVWTAGLAMSEDGATLWAACESGIFEFDMNRKARMFRPAVAPR